MFLNKNGKFAVFAILPLIVLALLWWTRFTVTIPLKSRAVAKFISPGCFASMHESKYQLLFYNVASTVQTVELHGDYFSNPVLLFSSSNDLTIYCVYDHHNRLRMLKINPKSNSVPFSTRSALNEIVMKSPYLIQQGGKTDWETLLQFLNEPTNNEFHCEWIPTMDYGFARTYADPYYFKRRALGQFDAYFRNGWKDPWAD